MKNSAWCQISPSEEDMKHDQSFAKLKKRLQTGGRFHEFQKPDFDDAYFLYFDETSIAILKPGILSALLFFNLEQRRKVLGVFCFCFTYMYFEYSVHEVKIKIKMKIISN